MTYLGGNTAGYEAGVLKIGLANTTTLTEAQEWNTVDDPILSPEDESARWFENETIYKSLVIRDSREHTGYPFVMYYNAKGDTANYESIGMAVSEDMVSWKRVVYHFYTAVGDQGRVIALATSEDLIR